MPDKTDPGSAPPAASRAASSAEYELPFSIAWPLLVGVALGIALRFVFSGTPGGPYATMMSSFVILAPLLVGATTVYVAELHHRRSSSTTCGVPALANIVFVLGTLVILIEGLICAVVILPLFGALGAVGGLIMGAVCRAYGWPRRTFYAIAALPLVLGAFEQELPVPVRERTIEHARIVAAEPARIWREIENPLDIAAGEVESAWVYRIGVPLPKAGRTEQTGEGIVRHITMGSGIHFDEVAVDWQPERHVRWSNRFTADSFPPETMDEHVKIGGRYLSIGDTDYTLTPVGAGTELRMTVRYRLSTSFNWYAGPVLDLLVGNFEDAILAFYARRAEADGALPAASAGVPAR